MSRHPEATYLEHMRDYAAEAAHFWNLIVNDLPPLLMELNNLIDLPTA